MKYRTLEPGEVIQAGDEFRIGLHPWKQTSLSIGAILGTTLMSAWRRPIPDELNEEGWRKCEPTQRPTVICLCGSSKFPEAHMRAIMDETLAGRIVVPMGLYGHADFPAGAKAATNDGDESTEVKQMLDRLHFAKIDLADEILVVAVGGYTGSSTKREIEYARSKGKRVRTIEPPAEPTQGEQALAKALGEIERLKAALVEADRLRQEAVASEARALARITEMEGEASIAGFRWGTP